MSRTQSRSIAEAARLLKTSQSTVLAEVRAINAILPAEDRIEIRSRRLPRGKRFSPQTAELIRAEAAGMHYERYASTYVRASDIVALLLLEHGWISLDRVAERLSLSKTAVHDAIRSSANLKAGIEISPVHGIRLRGESFKGEFGRRQRLAFCLIWNAGNTSFLDLPDSFSLSMNAVANLAEDAFEGVPLPLSQVSFSRLVAFVLATALCAVSGFDLDGGAFQDVPVPGELRDLCRRVSRFGCTAFSEADIRACAAIYHQGSTFDGADLRPEDLMPWTDFLRGYWAHVAERYSVATGRDPARIEAFARHLVRLERRSATGAYESNELKREIQRRFPFATQLVRQDLRAMLPFAVPEAEIASLVLHVEAELEASYSIVPIVIVTQLAPAHVNLFVQRLSTRLTAYASTVSVMPTYRYRKEDSERLFGRPVVVTTDLSVAAADPEAIFMDALPEREMFFQVIDAIEQTVRERKDARSELVGIDVTDEVLDDASQLDVSLSGAFVCDTRALVIARFATDDEPSSIRRIALKRDFRFRSRPVRLVVVAVYNPASRALQDFYRIVRESISPDKVGWA